MPLSYVPQVVAPCLKHVGPALFIRPEIVIIGRRITRAVVQDVVGMGIFPCHEHGPARAAHRVVGDGVGEDYAVLRETVEVWCEDRFFVEETHGLASHLIGIDDDQVRSPADRFLGFALRLAIPAPQGEDRPAGYGILQEFSPLYVLHGLAL